MTNETTFTLLIAIFSSILGAIAGCLLTLWMDNRKERKQAKTRFINRLQCVASELPLNFKDVGNRNPFQTFALEKLVYGDELIHDHPDLFQKAHECLYTARILSTTSRSKLYPADGQKLMKDLANYIYKKFDIQANSEKY